MATSSQIAPWVLPRMLKNEKFTFEIFKDIRKAFEKKFPEYAYKPDGDMDGTFVDEDGLLFVEYMALTGRLQETTAAGEADSATVPFSDENKRLAEFIVQYVKQLVRQQRS
jgi:hypothetical protein